MPFTTGHVYGDRPTTGRGRAFTLVEVLIVVSVLAILAALVLPGLVNAGDQARASAIKLDLRHVRVQLQIYRSDHAGHWPELARFEQQMTMATNLAGNPAPVGTPGFNKGPYLRSVPKNPNTGTSDVGNGALGASAWYYDENTGEFAANDSAESREY
jgi:general secretion pathway protein G